MRTSCRRPSYDGLPVPFSQRPGVVGPWTDWRAALPVNHAVGALDEEDLFLFLGYVVDGEHSTDDSATSTNDSTLSTSKTSLAHDVGPRSGFVLVIGEHDLVLSWHLGLAEVLSRLLCCPRTERDREFRVTCPTGPFMTPSYVRRCTGHASAAVHAHTQPPPSCPTIARITCSSFFYHNEIVLSFSLFASSA